MSKQLNYKTHSESGLGWKIEIMIGDPTDNSDKQLIDMGTFRDTLLALAVSADMYIQDNQDKALPDGNVQ